MALYSLTPEHRDRLPEWRDLWLTRILRTEPQTDRDRAACTEAVDGLYRAAKLPPVPVIYVPSPVVGAAAWCFASMIWWLRANPDRHVPLCGRQLSEADFAAATAIASAVIARKAHGLPEPHATSAATDAATRDAVDAATRDATHDATFAATDEATNDATNAATRDAVRAATHDATYDATRDATRAATYDATNDATRAATAAATRVATAAATDAATEAATCEATDAATREATDAATRDATRAAANAGPLARLLLASLRQWARGWNGGSHWGPWCSYLSFFDRVVGLDLPPQWRSYEAAAIHGCHRYMHERFCLVSDFPTAIRRDEANRPHSGPTTLPALANGPALAWRDGWASYYWHGQAIPREWIESPESLTPAIALGQPNAELRTAAVEIVGWERILHALPHRVIAADPDPEIGTLISVDLPDAPDTRYVRARCGTGRTVHYRASATARTPLEAAAASYGLRPEDYRLEVRT